MTGYSPTAPGAVQYRRRCGLFGADQSSSCAQIFFSRLPPRNSHSFLRDTVCPLLYYVCCGSIRLGALAISFFFSFPPLNCLQPCIAQPFEPPRDRLSRAYELKPSDPLRADSHRPRPPPSRGPGRALLCDGVLLVVPSTTTAPVPYLLKSPFRVWRTHQQHNLSCVEPIADRANVAQKFSTPPSSFAESTESTELPTVESIIEERKSQAAANAQKAAAAKPKKQDSKEETTAENTAVAGSPAALEEEADQQGAFNPETGEINWDCPCLGGMADGPCGEEFKTAFSCFVYSNEEPKGMECIDKFQYV